eukprot:scaffold19911_cov59-Phaeocystis_antarctica.AAC.5
MPMAEYVARAEHCCPCEKRRDPRQLSVAETKHVCTLCTVVYAVRSGLSKAAHTGPQQHELRTRVEGKLPPQWEAPRARLGPVRYCRRVARALVEGPCGAHEDYVEHGEREGPEEELACGG